MMNQSKKHDSPQPTHRGRDQGAALADSIMNLSINQPQARVPSAGQENKQPISGVPPKSLQIGRAHV